MKRYLLGRLLQSIITLIIISLFVFGMVRLTGSPIDMMLPIDATPEMRAELAHELALDKPLPIQYFAFLADLVQGDLGTSIRTRLPVTKLLMDRLPSTLLLVGASIALAILAGVPLGILAAMRRDGPWDLLGRFLVLFGQSVPTFWAGIVLISIFAVQLRLLPAGREGGWEHLVLPSAALGLFGFMLAGIMRLLRGSMIETLESDYVRFARIKGLSEVRIAWKHALPNALIPVITFIGFYFGIMISGAIVVETVFAWPGIGRLAFEAVQWRDYPVVQGVVLLIAVITLAANLLVDFLYSYLDPRIRIR
ncbi:MAG: ABC transporter permease [Hyphomicrobiales bacterium]|nr:ABC transporter permease [Hyphomicrobiales bacterium]